MAQNLRGAIPAGRVISGLLADPAAEGLAFNLDF